MMSSVQTSLLLIFVLVILYPNYLLSADMASINGEKVLLREAAEKKSRALWELGSGFPVEIIKQKGDWLFIKDFENDRGWIHKSRITRKQHVVVKVNKNEEQAINVRKEPNLESLVVANAFYGVVFSLLQKRDGWIEVQHDSGVKGWIKAELLWGIE